MESAEVIGQLAAVIESGGNLGIWVIAYFLWDLKSSIQKFEIRITKLEWNRGMTNEKEAQK